MKVETPRATQEQVTTWINLHQTVRVIQGLLEERLRMATGLSWPEFELLMRLQLAAGHPLQMNEIASLLVGSPSGATRMADRLEKDGLITRETPRENRRIVRVQLTDSGRRLLAKADDAFRSALQECFGAGLSEAEVGSMRRMLRKLLERNGAWSDARCSPPAPPATS